MANLIILFSNCFACLHFRIQVRQKQWLQFGRIPNRRSRGDFSITTSKHTPHVLSLDRATAKDNSISCSCCLMHSWNTQFQYSSYATCVSGMWYAASPKYVSQYRQLVMNNSSLWVFVRTKVSYCLANKIFSCPCFLSSHIWYKNRLVPYFWMLCL